MHFHSQFIRRKRRNSFGSHPTSPINSEMNTDLRVVDERHLRTDGGPTDIAGKSAMSGSSEINPNCQVVYQELKLRRKYRYIIYKIGEEDIDVEHTGATAESFEDFKSKLPFTECRYTHLLTQSLTHSFTHLLIYLLAHSLIYSLTHVGIVYLIKMLLLKMEGKLLNYGLSRGFQ